MFGSRSSYCSIKKIIFVFLLASVFPYAQEQKGSTSGTIFPKEAPNFGLLIPDKTVEDYSFLNKPDNKNPSMTDNEQFIDPGAKYLTKLNKEGSMDKNTYLGDTYLGDFITVANQANILLRDFGQVDGDHVRVLVNDEEIVPIVMLKSQFYQLKLPLKEGFNKIQFVALNQGKLYPNTAELRIYDNFGTPLVVEHWNLSTGAKATLILVREGTKIRPQ